MDGRGDAYRRSSPAGSHGGGVSRCAGAGDGPGAKPEASATAPTPGAAAAAQASRRGGGSLASGWHRRHRRLLGCSGDGCRCCLPARCGSRPLSPPPRPSGRPQACGTGIPRRRCDLRGSARGGGCLSRSCSSSRSSRPPAADSRSGAQRYDRKCNGRRATRSSRPSASTWGG